MRAELRGAGLVTRRVTAAVWDGGVRPQDLPVLICEAPSSVSIELVSELDGSAIDGALVTLATAKRAEVLMQSIGGWLGETHVGPSDRFGRVHFPDAGEEHDHIVVAAGGYVPLNLSITPGSRLHRVKLTPVGGTFTLEGRLLVNADQEPIGANAIDDLGRSTAGVMGPGGSFEIHGLPEGVGHRLNLNYREAGRLRAKTVKGPFDQAGEPLVVDVRRRL